MKLSIVLLLFTVFQVQAKDVSGQNINLQVKQTEIRKVLNVFEKLYAQAFQEYKKDDSAATAFAKATNKESGNAEHAALKLVANAMLNIDEVITKN